MQRLYEDNISEKISDERFAKLSASYENEQEQLNVRLIELRGVIEKAQSQTDNVDKFLALVRKYDDIQTLDAEILRTLVKRIVVHQPDKSSGHRRQQVDVEFTFIGDMLTQSEGEKTA